MGYGGGDLLLTGAVWPTAGSLPRPVCAGCGQCPVWPAAPVSDECIGGGLTAGLRRTRRCAIQIDSLYLYLYQPVSENIGHCCLHSAACGDLAVPATRTAHYSLRRPQLCCGWSINMELSVSIALTALSSFCRQLKIFLFGICFISTLATIYTVRVGGHNFTVHNIIHVECMLFRKTVSEKVLSLSRKNQQPS